MERQRLVAVYRGGATESSVLLCGGIRVDQDSGLFVDSLSERESWFETWRRGPSRRELSFEFVFSNV